MREKYSGKHDARFGPTLAAEHLASEAPGSLGEKAAAAGDQRSRGRQCLSCRGLLAHRQCALRAAAASLDDYHVAIPRGLRLDMVFRLEETRTVSNDWVVRYANRHSDRSAKPTAPGPLNRLDLRSGRRPDRDSVSRPRAALPGAVDRPARGAPRHARLRVPAGLGAADRAAPRVPIIRGKSSSTTCTSCFASGAKIVGRGCARTGDAPAEAAGRPVDAKSTRPPVPGKRQNRFHEPPQGIVLLHHGDISNEL
jgi:hypothetical protein